MIRFLLVAAFLLIQTMAFAQKNEITMYTTMGEIVIEIEDTLAPITAGNFFNLTWDKFYDGIIYHRVIDNFMIQGGDPTGTGSGGSEEVIPDEFDEDLSNVQATISMANAGPNTGTSQFFINLVNNVFLDYDQEPLTSKHPVFGRVVEGFDVVQDIGNVATDGNDRPLVDVVMDSVRITQMVFWHGGTSTDIEETFNENKFLVYPNPINESSRIYFELEHSEELIVQIVDGMGRVLRQETFTKNEGKNSISFGDLNANKLQSGIYGVFVQTKSGSKYDNYMIMKP